MRIRKEPWFGSGNACTHSLGLTHLLEQVGITTLDQIVDLIQTLSSHKPGNQHLNLTYLQNGNMNGPTTSIPSRNLILEYWIEMMSFYGFFPNMTNILPRMDTLLYVLIINLSCWDGGGIPYGNWKSPQKENSLCGVLFITKSSWVTIYRRDISTVPLAVHYVEMSMKVLIIYFYTLQSPILSGKIYYTYTTSISSGMDRIFL